MKRNMFNSDLSLLLMLSAKPKSNDNLAHEQNGSDKTSFVDALWHYNRKAKVLI